MEKTLDKITALSKSRGFVYLGSEIYGGLANTWDYGNLGVAKGGVGGQRYSGVATALHDTANLIARIFCVPFIEQILHGNDVAYPVGGVDVVHDGDIPHV